MNFCSVTLKWALPKPSFLTTRRVVVGLPSRWPRHPATAGIWRFRCNSMSGIDSLSATAKWPVRHRGSTRYRGLRYRGLFVFYPDITKISDPQIEPNGCGRKDEEDEADEEDDEDEADEARRGNGR